MAENGKLPASDLAPIKQGQLRKDCAAAWNCGRCGYAAMSSPYEDFVRDDDVEGTETHKCPVCGEQWWLDAETYARMDRRS